MWDLSQADELRPPPTPAPTGPLPSPPLPVPTERRVLPKKGSLSNLRSALTKKASSTALRTVRSTANLTSGSAPLLNTETPPLPLPQPKWRDLNLPSPKMRDLELSDGCFPPMTPSRDRRNPKSSIGQPHLQPSTSPSAFLKDLPRPAPGRPKVETGPTLPSSDWAHPLPVPDFAQSPGNMTLESPHIGTPISTTGDLVANYETPSAALTARAARADSTLKPRRLVSLLPRQQKINLGIQTPPSTGLRTKKSTGDVSALLKSTPHQNRSAIGLPTPGPTPLERHIDTSRPRSRRDPLGIIRRCDNIPLPSPSQPEDKEGGMPFPSGARDGWSTPAPTSEENKENEGLGYIGAYSARESALAPAFDFSASPVKTVSAGMTSKASVESEGLPSEEWELEAYLRELERVDQEKSGRVRDGVRAGGVV